MYLYFFVRLVDLILLFAPVKTRSTCSEMFDNSQKSPANRLQRGLVNLAASTQVATKELFGKPSHNDRASTLIAAVLDQLVIRLKPQVCRLYPGRLWVKIMFNGSFPY